ncbi:methyltransferase [Aureococcus anophagefferens]|nr:methyltransferase [Aureococcus anophagefferens]
MAELPPAADAPAAEVQGLNPAFKFLLLEKNAAVGVVTVATAEDLVNLNEKQLCVIDDALFDEVDTSNKRRRPSSSWCADIASQGYPLVDGKPLSIWVGAVAAECKKRGWEGFRDSKGKRKKRKTASNEKVFSDAGLKRHVEAGEDREDGRRTAKDGSAAASDDYRARLMQLQRIYFEKEWKQDGGARGYQTKVEMLKAHRLFCNPQIGTMRCNVCDIDVRKRGGRVFEHYFRVLDDGSIEYYARGFPCCGACNTSIIKDATDLGWDKLESAVAKQAAREWAVSVIDILKGE